MLVVLYFYFHMVLTFVTALLFPNSQSTAFSRRFFLLPLFSICKKYLCISDS